MGFVHELNRLALELRVVLDLGHGSTELLDQFQEFRGVTAARRAVPRIYRKRALARRRQARSPALAERRG